MNGAGLSDHLNLNLPTFSFVPATNGSAGSHLGIAEGASSNTGGGLLFANSNNAPYAAPPASSIPLLRIGAEVGVPGVAIAAVVYIRNRRPGADRPSHVP